MAAHVACRLALRDASRTLATMPLALACVTARPHPTSRRGPPSLCGSLCSESLAGGAVESLDQALVLIPVFRRKRPARFQQPVDPLRKFLFAAVKLGFFKSLHERIEVTPPRRRIGETYLRRTLEVL